MAETVRLDFFGLWPSGKMMMIANVGVDSSSGRFVTAACDLKRAIDSGHLASIADLAWLLLHGREGLPQNKAAAFKMAQEGSRRGCPHSQGVLALCYSSDEWYAR